MPGPDHQIRQDTYDLVVLSVGLCPNPSFVQLAQRIGIRLNAHGFCATDPLDLVATSRPGIYVCGVAQGPKDIPDSVQQASSAAERATALLADARGSLITAPAGPRRTRCEQGRAPDRRFCLPLRNQHRRDRRR